MPDSSPHGSTGPRTIGICPEPPCFGYSYHTDAQPGDRCPFRGHGGERPELLIYTAVGSLIPDLQTEVGG